MAPLHRNLPRTRLAAVLTTVCCVGLPLLAHAGPPDITSGGANGLNKMMAGHKVPGATAPAALTYRFKLGETHRYRVKAFFDGIIPPFSHPGGEPIHMLADIVYVSQVNKQSAQGTEVSFSVASADLTLLVHEVKTDEEIKQDDQTPFPIELTEIQKALNTTAVLKPDGSVSAIVSGNPNAVKLNIGFDLRKLFLLTMPITFPQKPLQVGDMWAATEGVLGSNPSTIHYSNRLTKVIPGNGNIDYQFDQTGKSTVSDTLDQQNNHTSKPDEIFSTLKGDISLDGKASFSAPMAPATAASGRIQAGRMMSGRLNLTINLQRKTTKADAPPEIKESTDGVYDVKARMLFHSEDEKAAARQTASTAPEKGTGKR